MKRSIRVVAPFRPFPPESAHHRLHSDFDWIEAIRMMSHSVEIACGPCPVHVITDVDTDLPMPALHYLTVERRLMLWYLEVAACYLESDDFDRDTVMLDSDQLVYRNLADFFVPNSDLGVLVRTKYPKGDLLALPILNGVQFWPIAGKALLGQFFRRALEIARTMPEEAIVWGADTLALAELLKPLTAGVQDRVGLRVALMDSGQILAAFAETQIQWLKAGRFKRFMATYAVLDFRGNRKPYMQPVYEATVAAGVTV